MTTERRPVCHRCAQIKQACDGSLPCSRCTRLSLPCRARENPDAPIGSVSPPGEAPKARIRRVQTGCLMCKQRKKKCDEMKPKCGDCRRLCLVCQWPTQRAVKKDGARKGMKMEEQTEVDMETLQVVRQTDMMGNGVLPVVIDASQQIVIRSHSPVLGIPPKSPANSVTSTVMTKGTKSESEMDSASIWDIPMATSPWNGSPTTMSNGSLHESVDGMSLSIYMPQLMPQLQTDKDRRLFGHYADVVSKALSRTGALANPYVHYLLPMAQSNPLILHSLLALSGNHWRGSQPEMGNLGLIHQSQATTALARMLPQVDKSNNADVALVSSLLLCMTELFDGTSEGWQLHLRGAKRLLAMLKRQHGESWTGHYKFLLRLARFLDSAATVSTCRPPLMEEEARDAEILEGASILADQDDSAVYGIPKELFHLVDLINSLAEKRKTRVDEESDALFLAEAAQVETRINTWHHNYGSLHLAVETVSPGEPDALYATVANELALRLRLHQIVQGYETNNTLVIASVRGILENVQRIRFGSPIEPCLMFPLVMAGGACWELEQRDVIKDRLMIMERTCGFGYVLNARDLMERVWLKRDQEAGKGEGEIVNWAKIRYEEMHGLVVF